MEVNVLIDQEFKSALKKTWLKEIVKETLKREGIDKRVEVGLVITTQERIRQLNRQYRGRDEPTDVLAFSAQEMKGDSPPFIQPPDGVRHLGEVVVSYPQALLQAEREHHPVAKEVALLIIHGVLHLLGYEHDEPERERIMKAREEEILNHLEGLVG